MLGKCQIHTNNEPEFLKKKNHKAKKIIVRLKYFHKLKNNQITWLNAKYNLKLDLKPEKSLNDKYWCNNG